MKQIWRKVYLTGIVAALGIAFAACGRQEQEEPQNPAVLYDATQGYKIFYQTLQIENPVHASGFNGWIEGSNLTGQGLYYFYQPTTGPDKSVKLYQVPYEELYPEDVLSGNYPVVRPVELTQELPLPEDMKTKTADSPWIVDEFACRFFQGEAGEQFYLNYYRDTAGLYLYHVDREGRELSRVEVTEALKDMALPEQITTGYLDVNPSAVDAQGRVYLTDMSQGQLWILDARGGLQMRLTLPENTQYLAALQDGQVYLVTGEGADSCIRRLDGETGDVEKVMDMPMTRGTGALMFSDARSELLYRDYAGLYVCDPQKGSAENILAWDDMDLSGKNILHARENTQGRFYIWEDDYSLTQVTQFALADIPQEKQTVTVAVAGSNPSLEQAIVEFNRRNAYYEAELISYDYSEGPRKLEVELATGKAPDLLDAQLLYVNQLVGKGLLADLAPYLEDGKGIERKDLVEAVLRCNTVDGILTCIPESFALDIVVGKPQILGEESGWTLEEFRNYIQTCEGLEIMGSDRYGYDGNQAAFGIVFLPVWGDIDSWLDYEQGVAHFDREDFLELLELAGSYRVTEPAVDLRSAEELQEGRMLTYLTSLYNVEEYLLLNVTLQQEVTYKGYPTWDGSPAYSLNGRGGYAINAGSQVQDGAWALIEFLMTYYFPGNSPQARVEYFSSLKYQFDYQMSQAMVKEYQRDSFWDIAYDEEGQPIEISKYKKYDRNGQVIAESTAASQQDVDNLRSLIDAASQSADAFDGVPLDILLEEVSAYLEGQRTASETVEIIQNRIQLFMNEGG